MMKNIVKVIRQEHKFMFARSDKDDRSPRPRLGRISLPKAHAGSQISDISLPQEAAAAVAQLLSAITHRAADEVSPDSLRRLVRLGGMAGKSAAAISISSPLVSVIVPEFRSAEDIRRWEYRPVAEFATLFARVLRVGVKKPRVQVLPLDGMDKSAITFDIKKAQVCAFARLRHQEVELTGEAIRSPRAPYRLLGFRLDTFRALPPPRAAGLVGLLERAPGFDPTADWDRSKWKDGE